MSGRLPLVALCAALLAGAACSPKSSADLPPQTYRDVVTAFYVGVSAMQTTQEPLAREKFDRVIALAPREPAGFANRGLLSLRQQDVDRGLQDLAQAATLAPDSAAIQRLQGLGESRRGNLDEAIAHWRKALQLDPQDRESAYALALDLERQGGADKEAEAQRALEQLVARRDNLAARLEYARIAAKRGDQTALQTALAPLAGMSTSWSADAREQLGTLTTTAASNARAAAVRVVFLKNVLLREPAYRAALAEVSTPRAEVGQPLMRFLRLKNPDPQPAAADTSLMFTTRPVANASAGATWVGAVSLTDDGNPAAGTLTAGGVRIAGAASLCRGWAAPTSPAPDAVAVADLNYDFRADLVMAGTSGLCLLRNEGGARFADVSAATKLPASILRAPSSGVWPADVDTDGDLDLVVASRDGHPIVLRNNGDGTFTPRDLFAAVDRARGFVWADLDGEGVPDAALLDDRGAVHVFLNQRGGSFQTDTLPSTGGGTVAILAAAHDSDAVFELLILARDGTITRIARNTRDRTWGASTLARVDGMQGLEPGTARLIGADLDNNGAADLIVASPTATRVLLAGPSATYTALPATLPFGVQAAADLDGDGRLDLLGLDRSGQPLRASGRGSKSYHWQVFRPRAATATGDQRINSFGIGGEIEVRSGLHLQKQTIASPIVHVGLGEATGAEVVRITWPNGVLQAEFDTKADQTVKAAQRLKGSCPWLFAWNGREMAFATDLLWRSPLGLRINAQTTADTVMTEDWVTLRGDQLSPRDGAYDLRITAELWETHFFDLVSLLVVDHPRDTEVFVDERFAVPPPALRVVATGPVGAFAAVRDDRNDDVSDLASAVDSRYVDFAGRGAYQGITRPHYVELELPEDAPRRGPLLLVARGWIHPTDSSINVAIGQGSHAAPEGLSLQVADASGRFKTVRAGLGFPAGKDKTILIDLAGLFGSTGPRRMRLATNLEIFWDRLGWAVARPDVELRTRRVAPAHADLAYRGFSITDQPSPSVPERPRYQVVSTVPQWRDLEGYYTRFGDVLPLLRGVDDRYVIMNAGDELRLRFPEAPAPANGWVRDFVVVADGWEKDGDYNTSFSRTVLPLPTHKTGRYDRAPGRLEDDPVYRDHAADFAEYHTRYVTSDLVRDALRTRGESGPRQP